MDKKVFRQLLNRPADSHKYDYGHVLVIGGSPGMVGAPFLTAMSALRVGAGLVTIASTKDVVGKLEERVVELMTLSLPASKPNSVLEDFITERKVSVVVIGPGMKPDFALKVLKQLLTLNIVLVIDGGALTALASHLDLLEGRAAKVLILTPHLGEFNRFFARPPEKDQVQIVAAEFVSAYKVNLVLKGHPTYVFGPKKESYKESHGGPELATAGSGDVLAGLIAGIIAQGVLPQPAIKAAVYLHAQAGKLSAKTKTVTSVIASDIIDALPAVLKIEQVKGNGRMGRI